MENLPIRGSRTMLRRMETRALVSSGWMDPIEPGPRFFTVGANINRPDRTNFYLGYRHYDPLESRAIVGAVTYAFSAKYAITASTIYGMRFSRPSRAAFSSRCSAVASTP